VIQKFGILIPKNTESLFVTKKSNKTMCFSVYKKLIRQNLTDIGIDSKYGLYSLKHTAINKLFRLNLTVQQINKVARYALNSTMALAHYNPTSSSFITDNGKITNSSKFKEDKEYLDFFGEDEKIEQIVKEISLRKKEKKKERKEKKKEMLENLTGEKKYWII
jgi:hypothetical protein